MVFELATIGFIFYALLIATWLLSIYIALTQSNAIKRLVALSIFQVPVFVFYIATGYVHGGAAPIVVEGVRLFANPLPHVLILTAIVVSVATLSVGIALAIQMAHYGQKNDND